MNTLIEILACEVLPRSAMRFAPVSITLFTLLDVAVSRADADDLDDARNDIVDIRHGRMPSRVRALGWTLNHELAVRVTNCQESTSVRGDPSCEATLIVLAPGKPARTHVLFASTWDDTHVDESRAKQCPDSFVRPQSPVCWIDQPAASRFLATERALRANLGVLSPAPSQRRPFHLGSHHLELRGGTMVAVRDGKATMLGVTVRQDQCSGNDDHCLNTIIDRENIEAVYDSPDGNAVAVVARYATHSGHDFHNTFYDVKLFPILPQDSAGLKDRR
ncbi:MAG: hypothetical protein H6Q90_6339 [Deltaproteobacteria bacterium]|nr:hypothetical protein [Deltaproteobacteria bacterium]